MKQFSEQVKAVNNLICFTSHRKHSKLTNKLCRFCVYHTSTFHSYDEMFFLISVLFSSLLVIFHIRVNNSSINFALCSNTLYLKSRICSSFLFRRLKRTGIPLKTKPEWYYHKNKVQEDHHSPHAFSHLPLET